MHKFWIISLWIVHLGNGLMMNNTAKDAGECAPSCLKCSPQGCLKCPDLIVFPSRACVSSCPSGHSPRWLPRHDFIGRVCAPSRLYLGLRPHAASLLVGALAGAVLSAMLVGMALLYLRRRRRSPPPSDNSSEADDSPERRDFLKHLESLRPYAHTYLDMLNDTRRQLRESHSLGDHSAPAAYKPMVRDLAKILLLLNRPTERITTVPEDWEHLFSWAEKALKRFKRMSDVSQPQVAQLISFLQGPVIQDQDARSVTTMSTFKPDQPLFGGSELSLQSAAVKSFHTNYESALNPQWKFECQPKSEFNPAVWKNSKEYLNSSLFLDDDFYQLGFRPQDEITTEL